MVLTKLDNQRWVTDWMQELLDLDREEFKVFSPKVQNPAYRHRLTVIDFAFQPLLLSQQCIEHTLESAWQAHPFLSRSDENHESGT